MIEELAGKNADIEAFARKAMRKPVSIAELVEGLKVPKGTLRYACEKVLRRISEQRPALLMPYFDGYAALLDSENSFIAWGAILTLGNLVAADADRRFDRIFR